MEKSPSSKIQKQYNQGFAFGIHPAFADCEDLSKCAKEYNNDAFKSGFADGRVEYIRLNGPLCDGLPKKLLTPKLVEHFELLGKIAWPLEIHGFSKHQTSIIQDHYKQGLSAYDAASNYHLLQLLDDNGIEMSVGY